MATTNITIESSDVTFDNEDSYTITTFASDINFRPGFAPRVIKTNSIGNKCSFVFHHMEKNAENENIAAVYKQQCGLFTLIVYND